MNGTTVLLTHTLGGLMGEREDAIRKIVGGVFGSLFGVGWLSQAIFAWKVPWFWWAAFNESGWWVLLALLLTFIGVAPLLVSIGFILDGIKKLGQSAIPEQLRDEAWRFEEVHSSGSESPSTANVVDVVGVTSSAAAKASINGLHAELYNDKELSGVQGMIDEATLVALGLKRSLLGLSNGAKGESARTIQQASRRVNCSSRPTPTSPVSSTSSIEMGSIRPSGRGGVARLNTAAMACANRQNGSAAINPNATTE